jgi:hypothetical protein
MIFCVRFVGREVPIVHDQASWVFLTTAGQFHRDSLGCQRGSVGKAIS